MKLPRATLPIAAASIVSLGAQALFSLLLLRLFTPTAVGEFSVISQVAFFWTTLALAQSQLSMVADIHLSPTQALRAALRGSLLRLGLLLPLAWAALAVSWPAHKGQALGWAFLLALPQLGWALAQSFTLRSASGPSIALGRAVPPVVALAVAALLGSWLPEASASDLMLASALAYATGALWLLPARQPSAQPRGHAEPPPAPFPDQRDDRATALRLAHTAADALTGTAILLVWQRSHGAAEAGHLAVLLRVLGFVPAVIHTAWAQALLAQGVQRQEHPIKAGLTGVAVSIALGLACALAIQHQWLQPSWAGLLPYLPPLVLWQASACLLAAYSHLPFQRGRACDFSRASMAFDGVQLLVLCAPLALTWQVSAAAHATWLGGVSATGLIALTMWLARLRGR